jgi:YbbR domain-containing protein
MNRIVGLIFHNWPLKLAAILLASMLYAGFVVSQSVQELNDRVVVAPRNLTSKAVLSGNLPDVTRIRYIAVRSAGDRASADSFKASINLASVQAGTGPTFVPIDVQSVDPRFVVVSYDPPGVNVQLDPLASKDVPVSVETGDNPPGLDVRPAIVTPRTVKIIGPKSVIDRVVKARADVVIEPNGLDINRDVNLIPVDILGNELTPADVEPSTAHVRINVLTDSQTRSLAVLPIVTGTPADGFEVVSVSVTPLLVPVEGDTAGLEGVSRVNTAPVSISGATQDVIADVALSLPVGLTTIDVSTVRVTVRIRAIAGSRNFDAGIVVTGAQATLDYRLSASHALVTVGGALVDLERLDAATFTVSAQVGGLGPGTHRITLEANLPLGLTLDAIKPPQVDVTVTVAAPSLPTASP